MLVALPGFKAVDKFAVLFNKKLFNSVFSKPLTPFKRSSQIPSSSYRKALT